MQRFSRFSRIKKIATRKYKTKGMHDVVSRFSVLFPANHINKEENSIIQEASSLQSKYPDDISPEFPVHLSSFRMAVESEIKKNYNS